MCNLIEDTWIWFLINLVTKPRIPKLSFNTLPYSSGSFIQMVGGGGGACGACGATYLTPIAVLPPVPVGANGGTTLAWPSMAEVGGIVEMGTGSGV
jgi:hypothetical protein